METTGRANQSAILLNLVYLAAKNAKFSSYMSVSLDGDCIKYFSDPNTLHPYLVSMLLVMLRLTLL